VTYSYTQLAQYLACPLRYRYRYLDGWQEKETQAGLLFGRAFEQALAALFRREDPGCALFGAWSQYKNASLEYSKNESWAIWRSSSAVRWATETSSSPMSMPSAN
jgi:hypothetical protein